MMRPSEEIWPALKEWCGDDAELRIAKYGDPITVSYEGVECSGAWNDGKRITLEHPERGRISVDRTSTELKSRAPRIGGNASSIIEVIGGMVIITCSDHLVNGGKRGRFFAHDIGHFIASPFGDLLKFNLGMGNGDDVAAELYEGHPLSVLEEEAIINGTILLHHLGFSYHADSLVMMIRKAAGPFKVRGKVIRERIEANDYDDVRAGWEERIAYVRKAQAPEEADSLEDSLAKLLGI